METENSALVVIDLQNDFTLENGKASACIAQVNKLIPVVNNLAEKFANTEKCTVYLKTEWSNPIIKILTGNSVKKGTPGAEFDNRLKIYSANIFTKGNKNSFSCSDFVNFLESNSVNHLYLAGLATEYCIRITAENAMKRGYKVSIVSNAVAAYKCANFEKSLELLSEKGVSFAVSNDIL